MKIKHASLALAMFCGSLVSNVHAALSTRAEGALVYDEDINLTWAADGNLFKTMADSYAGGPAAYVNSIISASGGSYAGRTLTPTSFNTTEGTMNWYAANAWANTLSYRGYDDWRLPNIVDLGNDGCHYIGPDCGYNPDTSGSEMAHLYYDELNRVAEVDQNGQAQSGYGIFGNGDDGVGKTGSVGPFYNITAMIYWSATAEQPASSGALAFGMYDGLQSEYNSLDRFWAIPVRVGDVAAVPLPAAVWLFAPSVVALFGLNRRGRNR